MVDKIDDKYVHEVPVCYKCEREIEPQVRPQWFVKCSRLPSAAAAIKAATPRSYRKLRAYPPALAGEHPRLERVAPSGVGHPDTRVEQGRGMEGGCRVSGRGLGKDPDTFDTWFSSGQWPFITLGFPDSKDFKTFYPTDVMETGADLIFFWVARMLMLGLYRTGAVPFTYVYMHGMVRDALEAKNEQE